MPSCIYIYIYIYIRLSSCFTGISAIMVRRANHQESRQPWILDQYTLTVPHGDDNGDETVQEYLEQILQDEDAYEDLEGLVDAVQPFLEDNRQVAEKLVHVIAESRPQTKCPPKSTGYKQ
jgi:hypothetical protein